MKLDSLHIKRILITLLLVACTSLVSSSFAQSIESSTDYAAIDAKSKSVLYKGSIDKLVADLVGDYTNDFDKLRAIYFWITENIKYDYKTFNKDRKYKSIKCKDKNDCEIKMENWRHAYIKKVLQKKKAICFGYAELFKELCNLSGIQCELVTGYTKTEPYQIGKMGILDHAWNTVIIDKNYYYFDLTWAAGYCTKNDKNKLDQFIKLRNDYYWLTPIDKLSRNHFPKDTTLLVNSKYNKELFKSNPYIHSNLIANIDILAPSTGILNAKVGDSISFVFTYPFPIEKIQVNTNLYKNPKIWKKLKDNSLIIDEKALSKQQYIPFLKKDTTYSFNYVVSSKSLYYIEILFEHKLALKYLIKIIE